MYQLSELKKNLFPSNRVLQSAIGKMNEDNPDPRPLMAIGKRIFGANLRLRGHQLVRQTAVTSFSWTIKPTDEADAERAASAAVRCKSAINNLLHNHHRTPLFGLMLARINWVQGVDSLLWPQINILDPTEVYEVNKSAVAVLDPESDQLKETEKFDENEFNPNVLIDIDSLSFERGGILLGLAQLVVMRWDMLKEFANTAKKQKGIVQAEYSGPPGGPDQQLAEEALSSAVKDNYVVSPSDAVKFSYNQITGNGDIFPAIIDSINSEAAIAILGQANTSEIAAGSGSRAALQVLQRISADIHYSDIKRCEKLINDLLYKEYVINYDRNATACPWVFTFNLFEDEDYESNANTARTLLETGIPLRKSEVYERTGYTMPAEGDDVFTSPNSVLP